MATVLLLGRLRDVAGWRERALPTPPARLTELIAALAAEDAALGAALTGRGVQTALNKVIVRGDQPLAPGDEIAFLPPMSGG